MRAFSLILAAAAIASPAQAASDVKFPYESVIEAEEAYVRSGSSTRYYPTGKLHRGDKVIVHRHDPGGWFMIAPPPGSFSWVPAKYVQKTAPNRGMVTTGKVAVRVGSFESDIREVFQRTLAEGDEVHIIDEKKLTSNAAGGSAELWYRIEPPRGEWRWVMGQDVAPPSSQANRTTADDPFESPVAPGRLNRPSSQFNESDDNSRSFENPLSDARGREYLDDTAAEPHRGRAGADRPLVRKAISAGKSKSARNQDAILDELDRLDARFRSILERPSVEWDFGQLEHDYQTLQTEAESDNIRQMIETRLERIVRYRKTRSADEELARVQAETARRDAELAEIQRRQESQLISLRQPRFDGAGMVERASLNRRGAPRYVLLAPTGRVLAYLAPAPGVDLEGWVGRAAGVNGSRRPHPDLKSDLITVNRLAPVRLTP